MTQLAYYTLLLKGILTGAAILGGFTAIVVGMTLYYLFSPYAR